MRAKYAALGGVLVAAALTNAPVQGWQVSPEEHAKHHPTVQAGQSSQAPAPAPPQAKGMAGMKGMDMSASNARLDELLKKMNAAQGQAKVDAMAELLNAMVQQHQSMHGNMAAMMSKMHADGGAAK